MLAGKLDRRIEIWRKAAGAKNVLGEKAGGFALHLTLWASDQFMTREEKMAAAQDTASRTMKFTVRWSAESAGITTADQLRYGGVAYNIKGAEEYGRREAINIYVEGKVA